MASIQKCSNFAVQNSQFTIVQGSQYNITHIHNNRVFMRKSREKGRQTISDEYERVRVGNVYLTKAVGTTDIYDGPWCSGRRANARCTISIAQLRGEDKEAEFLHFGYSGPEAFEAFRRDFDEFSSIKHPNVAQMFGYNDQRGLPALIFYDALIPLNYVLFAENRLASALHIYFCFQFGVSEMPAETTDSLPTGELWIEPRSGTLRRGLRVQDDTSWALDRLSNAGPTLPFGPLSIQTYSDTSTVLEYLTITLPTETILEQIYYQHRFGFKKSLTAVEVLSYLTGSLWERNHRHITSFQWRGLMEMPQYVCEEWATDGHKVVMEDGSVRFQVANPTDFKRDWYLKYALFHNNKQMKTSISWLVQAHSVFGQLGIHEEEWEGYSISTHLALELHSTEENACKQESTDTTSKTPTVYLFVQPIPRPSDDEMIWRSWAESAKYFWSVDHLGKEEMPESTRISLGIPSYRAKIEVWHQSWDVNAYKAIEKLHSSKGFDPKTTDFARSLGHPLMQVVGDEDRFEHLEDSTSSATIADILDSYNRDGLGADDPCPTTSEAPDPDEIVLYPRQRQ